MTVSNYEPSALDAQIAPDSDPDLALPSFSCAFIPFARSFCLWAWLDNEHRYQLTLAAATERMTQLTGFGPAYAQRLVRRGLGVLWDVTATGDLRLRSAGALHQQAVKRLGIFKRSRFRIPSDVLGGDLETLHAFLALPVMAGESGCTSRAYTAGLLGVSIDTVSRWRAILRARGYLVTAPMFLRLGWVAVAKGGRAKPMPAGSGTFQWGHNWYRRGPDAVATVRPKRNPSEYCSLRSPRRSSLRDGARPGNLGRDLAFDFTDCELKAEKFDGLAHACVDLLASFPDPEDAPPDEFSGPGALESAQATWEHDLRNHCARYGLLSESRLAAATDAVSGALNYPAARKAILAEGIRYRQLRDTWRERAWEAQGRELRAQNVERL